MANSYSYTLSLIDKISGNLRQITGTSTTTISSLDALRQKTIQLESVNRDFGDSLSSLRQKMDLLSSERELINPSNITTIRSYNKEIDKLSKTINKLENIKGGKLSGWLSGLKNEIPDIVKNPLVLTAAGIGASVKNAISLDEGMAKVNITAQLDDKALTSVKQRVMAIADKHRVDLTVAPIGLEQIISQTGDTELSIDILDKTLKASKAGFVEMDVAAAAAAQTLSIVGKENTTAAEVFDTFFAAKRVGAGEFKDFAQYMPGLIAGAKSLGVGYKDVAGVFAYMTGKGQKAADASVLMSNMFSILGRGEIREKLSVAGVSIFDKQGQMRGVVDIFSDLSSVMSSMNDEQKSLFIENVGVVDKEAKNSIMVMTADIDKLRSSINDTNNSIGETDTALSLSDNVAQRATGTWNLLKNHLTKIGTAMLPIVDLGLTICNSLISGVSSVVGVFSEWWSALTDGNPLIVALTTLVTGYALQLSAATLATSAKLIMDGLATLTTNGLTISQWALNAAMNANPISLVVAGVALLTGALAWAWQEFEGFRSVVLGSWDVLKGFGSILVDAVMEPIKSIISGIGHVGDAILKLFTGDFAGALDSAKLGMKDFISAAPIDVAMRGVVSTDWNGLYDSGAKRAVVSDQNVAATPNPIIPKSISPTALPAAITTTTTSAAQPKTETPNNNPFKLDKLQGLKGTTAYNAIAQKLAPIRIASMTAAATIGMTAIDLPESIALPQTEQHTSSYATSQRKVTLDKFCDSIVINIASADGKGYDHIKDEIINEITKALDNYEA